MDSQPILPPWAVDARQHLAQAYEHYEADRYPTALTECDAAIGIDPDLAEAHNLRGIVLEELDRPLEAVEAYQQAARLDPDLVEARDNLVQLMAASLEEAKRLRAEGEDLELALEKCDVALRIDPESEEVQSWREGLLEQMAPEPDEAIVCGGRLDLSPFLGQAEGIGRGASAGNEWAALARVNRSASAGYLRTRLVLRGIPTVLLDADSEGLAEPQANVVGGVWLLVRPADFDAALDELDLREDWEELGEHEGEDEEQWQAGDSDAPAPVSDEEP